MNSFGSISKKFTEKSVLGLHNLKAYRKDSYMQILTRTLFDFSMENIKVVGLKTYLAKLLSFFPKRKGLKTFLAILSV